MKFVLKIFKFIILIFILFVYVLVTVLRVSFNHIMGLLRSSLLINVMYFKSEYSPAAAMKGEVNTLYLKKQEELFKDIVSAVKNYDAEKYYVYVSDRIYLPNLQYHSQLATEFNNFKKLSGEQLLLVNESTDYVNAFFITNNLNEQKYQSLKKIVHMLDDDPNWMLLNPVMQDYFKSTLQQLKDIHDKHIEPEIMQLYQTKAINNEPFISQTANLTENLYQSNLNDLYLVISSWYAKLYTLMPHNFFFITMTCAIGFILIVTFFLIRFILRKISKIFNKKIKIINIVRFKRINKNFRSKQKKSKKFKKNWFHK